MTSFPFAFAVALTAPPASGEIRLDAGPPYVDLVTRAWLQNLTTDGLDVRRALLAQPIGTLIYVQDRADHLVYVALVITAPALEAAGYLEIPVSCSEASTPALGAGPVEAFFLPAAVPVTPPDNDPVLVTMAVAKDHLRITDTAHDPDVTQKLAAASSSIRDYLKGRNDPTWTPDTAPPWIQAAVLLLLAHLYEHRGDEFGAAADNDDRVWSAIANLCRRSRDPALA